MVLNIPAERRSASALSAYRVSHSFTEMEFANCTIFHSFSENKCRNGKYEDNYKQETRGSGETQIRVFLCQKTHPSVFLRTVKGREWGAKASRMNWHGICYIFHL